MPLFLGLMSGTSVDGVDAALVAFDGGFPALIAARSHAIPVQLRRELIALTTSDREALDRLWQLDVAVGELFADAALELLREAGREPPEITAIGSHGQTVRHRPQPPRPYSVQLGDPNVIAERTGITTVADFRRRDVAAGGQGAPLVPAFHAAVFGKPGRPRAVVNIGGIANLTTLPGEAAGTVTGFDTGPGNVLLDAWADLQLGAAMDRNGEWAASGAVDEALLRRLRADEYFGQPPPKSTGRERFNASWLQRALADAAPVPAPADVQRTLCELTASTVAEAIERCAAPTGEVLVCGGGARNPVLMGALQACLSGRPVRSTAEAGLDPDWVEAMAFAWLARQTLEGRAGNLPAVTGAARAVVLGGIYRA